MQDNGTKLIAALQAVDGLQQIDGLVALADQIEYGDWDEANTRAVLTRLLEQVFKTELLPAYQAADLKRCLDMLLLMQVNFPLSESDLRPLFYILQNPHPPQDICLALELLAYTFDRKYIPIILSFVSAQEPLIADCAAKALACIRQSRGYWQLDILDPERIAQLGPTGELIMRLLAAMPGFKRDLLHHLFDEQAPTPGSVMQVLADHVADQIDEQACEALPALFAQVEQILAGDNRAWQQAAIDKLLETLQRYLLPREHWVPLLGPLSLRYIRDEGEFFRR